MEDIHIYLDDILVASENVEKHMSTIRKIFERLELHGLTLAVDKCTFGKSTIEYLGYGVSSTGIRPLKRKTSAIQKIPPPTTQKEMLHFLGALNYFRTSLSGLVKNGKYVKLSCAIMRKVCINFYAIMCNNVHSFTFNYVQ